MGTLYQIAKERALEYLELPEELPGRPAGTVGMPIQMGRLAGFEHNLEWKAPRTRAQLIGKMLRTSPILSLAEEYLTGRVTSVELTVKRREGVSEEACEALEMWLGIGKHRDGGGRLGDMTTDDLIRHLMSAKAYGNVAMSESWSFSGDLYFCSLHRRFQESYYSYITEKETGRMLGLVQAPSFSLTHHVLPLNQTLYLVNRPDRGWFDGLSILRPCFPHWRSEQLRYRLEDVIANKYADVPQQGKLNLERFVQFANGAGGAQPTREDFQAELADMASKLSGLHSSDSAHLLHPDYWEFTPRAAQHSYDPQPLLDSASHHQRACAEALHIAWVLQGRKGDGGSRSMVETQSVVAEDATIDAMQWILNALNRQTVRRFMKANFAGLSPEEMPIVSFERSSIKSPFWMQNPAAFANFVTHSIITPTKEDERSIRAAGGLPPPEEDSPSALDRKAQNAGGRLKLPEGQREAERPGDSPQKANAFVNRLVERSEE